jgi:hypothetical protein
MQASIVASTSLQHHRKINNDNIWIKKLKKKKQQQQKIKIRFDPVLFSFKTCTL